MSSLEKEPALDGTIPDNRSSDIQEAYVRVDGARMRYLCAGSGPPILLVHGLLGYSFSWRFTLPFLARHATVYAVDMLGTGFSERVPGLDCSLRSMAGRLLKFVEEIGLSRFDLLGASHGGAVAMMLAAACAEQSPNSEQRRVQRLILAAPVNPWSPHGQFLALLLGNSIGSTLFKATVARMNVTYGYWLSRLYGEPGKIPPGTLQGYSAPFNIPGTFDYALSVMRCWNSGLHDLESALPRIADYRTLLIWGSRDRAVDPGSAAPLQKAFRHCELVEFEGVGHLPYEEAPNEFNCAVLKFLQPTPQES